LRDTVIEVENLVRTFSGQRGLFRKNSREIRALDEVSFSVSRGELFGLLGPNGAGKTTTVKILTTLLLPTAGKATVLGYDVNKAEDQIRPKINFIFGGERGLYWRLSGRDNLRYFADLYRIDSRIQKRRIPELLDLVGLLDRADDRVETYSKGMKQRLHIARGLINDPEVLFLDEPTIGLDPGGARDLRAIIHALTERGKTVLLTTHYMFEADELCDRIAIINRGRIAALDTPAGLKRLAAGLSVIQTHVYGLPAEKIKELGKCPGIESVNIKNMDNYQILEIGTTAPGEIAPVVMQVLNGFRFDDFRIREATLEDAYLKLVGGAA